MLGVDLNTMRTEKPIIISGAGSTVTIGAGTGRAAVIGFYQSKLEQYNAQWLLHRYGSSFKLNIVEKYKDIADKTIWGNKFDGEDLVPVAVVKHNGEIVLHEIAAKNDEDVNGTSHANDKQFLLKKKGTDLYIALNVTDDWSNAVESFVQGGYMFETLSEANMKTLLKEGSVNEKNYYPYFQINYLEGKTAYDGDGMNDDAVQDNTPAHCIEVGYLDGNGEYQFPYDLANLETTDTKGHLDVFVSVVDNCGHNDPRMPQISFYTDNENIVRGEDATNNPLNYRYVNISFKSGAIMQFQNEENAWVNLNGKVLGIGQNDEVMPTEAKYFLFDKAEGQWAVSMVKDKDGNVPDSRQFVFTNRENPSKHIAVKSMHALGNDVYAVEYGVTNERQKPFGYYNNGDNQVQRDTLVIKQAEGNLKFAAGKDALNMDSYANWTKEQLQDRTFQLSIDASAQLYVTENEGKDSHFLGLTDDALEVTNWRLVPFTATRQHDIVVSL